MAHRILIGDCRETLRTLPEKSVQCVVTSPPYWGLRDYGHPDQLGLEPTPDEYVTNMVSVFREVWRVLRDDGVLWLNLGDSYCSDVRKGRAHMGTGKNESHNVWLNRIAPGLKQKDLVGIPWMVALTLRADGWYLRQDVIWSKGNGMPEAVKDRCTRAHEYLFMLTKQPTYFYDANAIREPYVGDNEHDRTGGKYKPPGQAPHSREDANRGTYIEEGRNKRSVWNVNSRPYEGAHFAVMPPALVEPCILAGSSEVGCCPTCGAPWERVLGRECEACGVFVPLQGKKCEACGHVRDWKKGRDQLPELCSSDWSAHGRGVPRLPGGFSNNTRSDGWVPGCKCPPHTPVPCTVLDPFGGSGTVGMVANWHGRDSILCELNPEYTPLIEERLGCARSENGGWEKSRKDPEVSLNLLDELA